MEMLWLFFFFRLLRFFLGLAVVSASDSLSLGGPVRLSNGTEASARGGGLLEVFGVHGVVVRETSIAAL